ncbi:TonB-dependent receptor [Mucilaginibacter robiniae]|uniref:TonB-dependent receptor n=1 Tax=Mucilaginibacter robiniae TaxID=2728022 RepID=A0A7L5DYT1_9SPHI|nr:TonB-dependent receptor [Mucilaginibacter robiniae]QJD95267.1 TonB-dependent receptor [Mucilaginibacter robiniae]
MKKLFLPLLLILTILSVAAQAQQTKQILKKATVDHFFTGPLDQMMDTLSIQYRIPIVFERDSLHQMDIAEHFFNESLMSVLKHVCRANNLQYWIENDGTLYIMQRPDDLPRLRKMYSFRKSAFKIKPVALPAPKGPPTRFSFALTGKVTDQNTGESLPGASVKVRNIDLTTLTNANGNFTLLNVPSDTVAIEVSYVGYQPDVFRLSSDKLDGSLVLALYPTMNALNEVTVTGKKAGVLNTDSKKVSVLQLTPAALDKLPNIGERDVMRAFQLMPGVSATNESSSGAYVRGGTPDQNLVQFDGFTVYQVDHLYGFFSAFNSNAVRDLELYKGGFSAKYGGRLSSVTDIRGKDGNKNEANIGGDLSLLSTNIYAETPIGSKSSVLVAFRRSYQGPLYDKIFGQFNTSTTTNNAPGGGPGGRGGFANLFTPSSHFYDFNAKYTYAPSSRNTFSWTFYSGSDDLNNTRGLNFPNRSSSSNSITVNDYLKSGNIGSSLKWSTTAGRKLFGNTILSYSGFWSDRNRGMTGSVTDSGVTKSINNSMVETNRLHDVSLKSDWELQTGSKVKLLFGGYASYLNIKYLYTQNDTSKLIDQHNTGVITGGYGELEIDPNSKLHLQPGLRATYYTPTGKFYPEPRFSATYDLTSNWKLKAATGRYYQFTNRVTREDITGGDRYFWTLANNSSTPVGSANHFIGGFSYETNNWLFDVEGYYKKLDGLTEYSIRQQGGGGPFSAGSTQTITENYYTGSGYAKGVEFLVQKKVGLYTGWIGYTLAQARNKFPAYQDGYFASPQDIRHEFKSINMYHWQRWSFAAVFIFSTGHPYTAPLGSYTVTNIDGNKTTYLTISGKYGERLPDYHRLDLSATYDLLKIDGRKYGSIGISLFNVYNHVNTWYNEYYIQNNQVITSTIRYLGFTPNITLSLKIK